MRNALLLLILLTPLARVGAAPSALVDRIAAVINDEVILLSEIAALEPGGDSLQGAARAQERRAILERIIEATLLEQEAARLGLEPPAELIAEEVDAQINRLMASWPEPRQFDDHLASRGLARAELRQTLREDEAKAWLRRTLIAARVGPPPAEVDLSPQLALAQITLSCPPDVSEAVEEQLHRECLELRARVLEGEEFGDLAIALSTDPVSGPRGGTIGVVEVSALDAGIAEALADLEAGDVSLPVRTEQAWHLFQVQRRISARQRWHVAAFEETRTALIEELRGRAHIEIFLEE